MKPELIRHSSFSISSYFLLPVRPDQQVFHFFFRQPSTFSGNRNPRNSYSLLPSLAFSLQQEFGFWNYYTKRAAFLPIGRICKQRIILRHNRSSLVTRGKVSLTRLRKSRSICHFRLAQQALRSLQ